LNASKAVSEPVADLVKSSLKPTVDWSIAALPI